MLRSFFQRKNVDAGGDCDKGGEGRGVKGGTRFESGISLKKIKDRGQVGGLKEVWPVITWGKG